MTPFTIRTRYVCHPGSNVGSIRATGSGKWAGFLRRQATVRIDQSLSREDMRRRAAEVLAARIGAEVTGAPIATDDPAVYLVPARFPAARTGATS